jgi:hypothetical protein
MITKEQLLNSIIHECNICRHLFTKIPVDKLEYSPQENMRSTLELLRYLTFAPYEFAMAMENDAIQNKNWKSYIEAEEKSERMKAEEFPKAMDEQIEKFKKMFDQIPDEDFLNKNVTPTWPPNKKLGAVLMDVALKIVTAYRMQLFLYVKLNGASVNTANCWSGID